MLSIKVTITGHAGMEKLMGCVRLSNSWIYFTYRNHFSPDYTFRGFDLIVRRLPAPQEPEENGTGEEGDHDEQHILSASHFYRLGPITTKYRMQKKTYTQGQFDHGEHSVTWAWNRHVIIPFICVNKNPFSLFIDTTSSQVHGLFIIFHLSVSNLFGNENRMASPIQVCRLSYHKHVNTNVHWCKSKH